MSFWGEARHNGREEGGEYRKNLDGENPRGSHGGSCTRGVLNV